MLAGEANLIWSLARLFRQPVPNKIRLLSGAPATSGFPLCWELDLSCSLLEMIDPGRFRQAAMIAEQLSVQKALALDLLLYLVRRIPQSRTRKATLSSSLFGVKSGKDARDVPVKS